MLPNDWKINIAGIEALKVATVNIEDRITRAIADTNPAALTESLGAATSAMVREQQAVVDAANAINLGKEADKIRQAGIDAGRAIAGGVDKFSASVDAKIKEFFKGLDGTSTTMVNASSGDAMRMREAEKYVRGKLGPAFAEDSEVFKGAVKDIAAELEKGAKIVGGVLVKAGVGSDAKTGVNAGGGGLGGLGGSPQGPQKTGDALVDEYSKKAWEANAKGDQAEVNRLSAELNRLKESATNYLGQFMGSMLGALPNLDHITSASDEALREIVRRNAKKIAEINEPPASGAEMAGGRFGRKVEIVPYDMERAAALKELELRETVRRSYARGGPDAVFHALPNIAPATIDRLIREFASQMPLLERNTVAAEDIARGLRRVGIIRR